jgi:hypothetical protein
METTKEFLLNGKYIKITNTVDENDNSKILTTGKYFFMNIRGERKPMIARTPKVDYYTQIKIQIDKLEGTKLTERDFFLALIEGCKIHIQKYGRLIISDLWSQLNYTMHLLDSTNKIFHTHIKTEDEGIELREFYLNAAQEMLIDYILVPDPKDFGGMGIPQKLVPLKNLIKK